MRLGTLLRAQPLSCSSLEGAVGDGSTGAEQSGRPANVWVRDFCAAITTYAESTNAREDDLETAIARASLGSNLHLTDLCRLIVDAANDELALTTEAGKAIRAAGHPAVENGAEISSAWNDLFERATNLRVSYRDEARGLPVDDPVAFRQ